MGSVPDIPNELYYFDENFSVRSLRKYQLKEILATHGIPYLHSITRVELINLFKKHIEPRREEIIAEFKRRESDTTPEEYGRGHRVSHKIIKEEFQEWPIRHKKTHGAPQKDSDGFAIPTLPESRKVSKFNAEDSFASSDEEAVKPKPRPTKGVTTKIKKDIAEPIYKYTPSSTTTKVKKSKTKFSAPKFNAEDSFASSDDNDEETIPEKVVKQKSPSPDVQKPKLPVLERNQSPEASVKERIEAPSTPEVEDDDDTDYNADGDNSDDEEEDLGEVDKDELVQLYKDQSVPPEIFYSPEYRVSTRSQRMAAAREKMMIWKGRLKRVALVLCGLYMIFALIGLVITSYARQKNGYCQNFPKAVEPAPSSTFFSMLPTSCIPCPDHGICTHGELVCDTLYERKTPFYNIGGLLPVSDDCVHNSVLGKYVGKVERKIKNQLAIRQGEAICEHFGTHPTSNEAIPVARVSVQDIIQEVKSGIQVPVDKMDEILVIALSAVLEDPKVRYWEVDDQRYLGTDHVRFPLHCQVKRLYYSIPMLVKIYIILLISAISAIYGASKDYRKSVLYKEKIQNLVKTTTDQLKEQYDNHTKDPTKYPSPALSVSQIRSSIVDVNDRRTIQDWQRVVEQIETHPHIRKSFREVRGDPVEYWELTA